MAFPLKVRPKEPCDAKPSKAPRLRQPRRCEPAEPARRLGSIAIAIKHKLAPAMSAVVPGARMAALPVRRADFLMTLAYATDLATGHSRDFALRSCVLGMRYADVAGLDQDTRRRIYHQALLRYIGCNADTHLLAAHWGDEITLRRELHHIDMGNRAEFVELLVRALKRKFAGAPPEELEEAVKRGLAEGPQVNIPILSGHCEVAQRIAERIGLPEDLRESLGQIYERWDGKGMPRGLSGNAVKFPVRVVTMAQDAIALNDHHGFAAMKEMITKRAGGGYEPELVDIFLTNAEKLLAGLDGPVDRETILALEPEPDSMLAEAACEEARSEERRVGKGCR